MAQGNKLKPEDLSRPEEPAEPTEETQKIGALGEFTSSAGMMDIGKGMG